MRAAPALCPACDGSGWMRWLGRDNTEEVERCPECSPPDPRIVECRACDGEGRILRGYDVDHGECPVCHGERVEECDASPVTLADIEELHETEAPNPPHPSTRATPPRGRDRCSS